jgi:hypothetical protein
VLIAINMPEKDPVVRSVPEFLAVSVAEGAGDAADCDAATDAADPVLEAGVSCPFRPGVTCEVVAASAEEVEEPVGEATVLEEPVVPWLDCVSKLDSVEDPDVGPVGVDTRELGAKVEEGAVELDGVNWPLDDVKDEEGEEEEEEEDGATTAAAFAAKPRHH